MKAKKIKTRHPEKGKKNREVPLEKYEIVKTAILKVLQKAEPTHTELVSNVMELLKNKFDENISWYTMVVKLDLEARKIIVRSKGSPARYSVK